MKHYISSIQLSIVTILLLLLLVGCKTFTPITPTPIPTTGIVEGKLFRRLPYTKNLLHKKIIEITGNLGNGFPGF